MGRGCSDEETFTDNKETGKRRKKDKKRFMQFRGVGAKLEVVRQKFSLLASFVIRTGASVYYSCQRQLMEFLSSEMAFWAKLATNIDPAVAMHNYS